MGAHLLVVDDEPHVARLIRHIFSDSDLRISTARTLEQARAAVRSGPAPDLLLLDVLLPDGLGLSWLEELRASDTTREMKVIVLSGAGFEDVVIQARDLDAGYVAKPFSPTKLRKIIEEALVAGREEAPE